jgi:hypothetical protein
MIIPVNTEISLLKNQKWLAAGAEFQRYSFIA